jgi:LuxR family maltose regulon positive regulatory protein
VGARALALLQSSQPPQTESILTGLINEINAIDADFTLVLDDYHVIDAAPVHRALSFLLDHLPPRLHLVLTSRTEPPLPLARLRARGEVAELRAAELRFTESEATAFLNQEMALELSATDLAALGERTEGWIAGLKLAALSMKGRPDAHGFVDAFSGDNRYVADYLVEEVLAAQPERIRRFLLDTAILERLSAGACDAVTGKQGSQALLEDLERRNLFVVALDDRREWYRYHHLFADVLQALSAREDSVRARALHGRASTWYERHGAPADAIRHAFAGEDLERAADLLEKDWPAMDRSHRTAQWLGRVRALPEARIRARPVLGMGYAWALLNAGELEAAGARLREVEAWLNVLDEQAKSGGVPPAEMVIADAERFRSLPVELASARVYLAQTRGDVPGTVEHAGRLLDLIPEEEHSRRATGIALLALAQWGNGELEAAHATFSAAIATMRLAGDPLSAIRGTFVLGDLRVAQGRLREAKSIYERGLQNAREEVQSARPETDELYLGLSEVHREQGDLEAALECLLTISEQAGRAEHAGNRERWCTAMARVREARGDLDGALALLEEAESIDVRSPLPRPRPLAAVRARIRIAQGKIDEAKAWVRARGLSVDDDLSYLREFEHVTLARVLLASPDADGGDRFLREAARLLDRLLTAAETGGRTGSVIEILALQVLTRQALGDLDAALHPLERALILAEPEGYLRVFVDEGEPMRDLLRHAAARGIAMESPRRVLAGFDPPAQPIATSGQLPIAASAQLLTARELVILRLIAAGMRNKEMARHLFISPATVKRHIANTYLKLGVSHRTEALARAKELELL